jgi:hypothetical protein
VPTMVVIVYCCTICPGKSAAKNTHANPQRRVTFMEYLFSVISKSCEEEPYASDVLV